jgi:hypothetical protein
VVPGIRINSSDHVNELALSNHNSTIRRSQVQSKAQPRAPAAAVPILSSALGRFASKSTIPFTRQTVPVLLRLRGRRDIRPARGSSIPRRLQGHLVPRPGRPGFAASDGRNRLRGALHFRQPDKLLEPSTDTAEVPRRPYADRAVEVRRSPTGIRPDGMTVGFERIGLLGDWPSSRGRSDAARRPRDQRSLKDDCTGDALFSVKVKTISIIKEINDELILIVPRHLIS